ncbi:MAG: hypothetical protein AAB553_00855 [Patescibacteria group bacterium]
MAQTGEEIPNPTDPLTSPIPIVKTYQQITTMDDLRRQIDEWDRQGPIHEGVVVKTATGERYKVKTRAYEWLVHDREANVPDEMLLELKKGRTIAKLREKVPPIIHEKVDAHIALLQEGFDRVLQTVHSEYASLHISPEAFETWQDADWIRYFGTPRPAWVKEDAHNLGRVNKRLAQAHFTNEANYPVSYGNLLMTHYYAQQKGEGTDKYAQELWLLVPRPTKGQEEAE